MKEQWDLKDLTIHDVQSISDVQALSGWMWVWVSSVSARAEWVSAGGGEQRWRYGRLRRQGYEASKVDSRKPHNLAS